jgi:hypothetical protein
MTLVDWLLTEKLVEIFRDARAKRPDLNAELVTSPVHGEPDVLAGAGIVVQIHGRDGGELVVTPKRITRVVGEAAADLVVYANLVGYDWISPEMSEKVALKDRYYDRLYLYTRDAPPVMLDQLGDAVYPLMAFLGRVLEYQSQKVLLRKLDDDVVERLGRCLVAAADGPFFTDDELRDLFRRGRESMRIIAGMWPRMNLAAPDVLDLLDRLVRALAEKAPDDGEAWARWIAATPTQLEAALEVFRRVSEGEV